MSIVEQTDIRETEPKLWVTDAELIKLTHLPEKVFRRAVQALDRNPNSGFPKKHELWGDRRYLPAVEAYFEHVYGYKLGSPK